MYYSCCDWCSSFINDFTVQKNIRKNEEHRFECTGTPHAYSCWAYTKTFCISFLHHPWYTSDIELLIEWYSIFSKDVLHSCLSCLPHQHKRPYIQAISFLPFSSPQTMVQDQKDDRSQFLCSRSFPHFRNDLFKKELKFRSWWSKSANVAKT